MTDAEELLRFDAHRLLTLAVGRGDLVRPTECSRCDSKSRTLGHHEDYSKPLDVVWLCYPCHGKRHNVISETLAGIR